MAIRYEINGAYASLAPFNVRWRPMMVGRGHDLRAIYSGNWEVDLSFGPASISWGQQWLKAASAASANVTILDQYKLSYTDLSAVQLEVVESPGVEDVNFTAWTMVIRGASPVNTDV